MQVHKTGYLDGINGLLVLYTQFNPLFLLFYQVLHSERFLTKRKCDRMIYSRINILAFGTLLSLIGFISYPLVTLEMGRSSQVHSGIFIFFLPVMQS